MTLAAPQKNRRSPRELSESESGARPIPSASSGPRNRRTAKRSVPPEASRVESVPPRRSTFHEKGAFRAKWRALGERLARVRDACRRPVMILLRGLAVIAMIVGSIALFRLIERHVRTSPTFAISAIEIAGASRLASSEISESAGLTVGQNVFDISPGEARTNLLAHPWIADARVTRRLPDRWFVEIEERVPSAILMLDEGWLVSSEGAVFKRLEPGDPADFPVITGIERNRFTEDRAFRTRVLLAIVALLSDWRAAGLWRREPISEIHVEANDSLTLRVGQDSAEIRLGAGPYRAKLDRLRRVLDELGQRHARPAYVYLDNVRRPDRVVVRVR
jgi:cell division protein FtsQ